MANDSQNPVEAAGAQAADWTRQVVDQLFEAEKKWIELATQQSELVLKTIREIYSLNNAAPSTGLADWARQGVESFVEAQRKWMENMTAQQSNFLNTQRANFMNAMPPGEVPTMGMGMPMGMPAGMNAQPMEYLVEAQRRWLDFATQQSARLLESLRAGMGPAAESTPSAAPLADWAQQAVNNYVEVQKRWLDLATSWMPRPNTTRE
jgi:hypothetical protein